jgi:ABC-type dipeptide/oligopeptide/nickel transport system ATPase component
MILRKVKIQQKIERIFRVQKNVSGGMLQPQCIAPAVPGFCTQAAMSE